MQKNQFENISNEVLLKEQKKLKNLNKVYGIILLIIFLLSLYFAFTKSNFTMVAICLALFSIYIVNYQSLKDFKTEVERRNLKSL